ncbi:isoprenoid synthase domain-containing protein [Mycena filopes]|nr:isoprenoid synthase domain-containing protein [Mycena filopes]
MASVVPLTALSTSPDAGGAPLTRKYLFRDDDVRVQRLMEYLWGLEINTMDRNHESSILHIHKSMTTLIRGRWALAPTEDTLAAMESLQRHNYTVPISERRSFLDVEFPAGEYEYIFVPLNTDADFFVLEPGRAPRRFSAPYDNFPHVTSSANPFFVMFSSRLRMASSDVSNSDEWHRLFSEVTLEWFSDDPPEDFLLSSYPESLVSDAESETQVDSKSGGHETVVTPMDEDSSSVPDKEAFVDDWLRDDIGQPQENLVWSGTPSPWPFAPLPALLTRSPQLLASGSLKHARLVKRASLGAVVVAVIAYLLSCSILPKNLCLVGKFGSHSTPSIVDQIFKSPPVSSKRERFEQTFEVVRQQLLDSLAAQGIPDDAQTWYKRNIDYNVPGGKLNRGLSVVDSVEIMKGRPLTDPEFLMGRRLQAFFLVLDDLMDKSITRRGQPCYYRVAGVGTISVNDATMLEAAIYQLLKLHFRTEPYYVDLLELFHDTTLQTSTGQLLDLITAPEDSVDLSKISLEKFQLIALHKTAYYSFYLPVALAMYMCQIPSAYRSQSRGETVHPYALARSILLPIGEYFQVQDDFLDFAGSPEKIGKIGTDIVDNKCSWCINMALGAASPEQRAILDANYGRRDAGMEAKVKAVFEELGLREKYRVYEEKVYAEIMALIESVPDDEGVVLKRQVFTNFVDKIYQRQK